MEIGELPLLLIHRRFSIFLIGLSAIFTTGSTIAISYIVFKEDIFNFYGIP